jgi:predicted PurR-regulated permease PerM
MKQNKNENTETSASVALANLTNIFLLLFMLFFVLYIGASLIIPFIIALLLTFAIIALYNFFKKLRFPPFLAIILSILTYLIVFWLI